MSVRKGVLAVVLGALMSPWAYADQVILKNGDRLTGSVTKSDNKTLTLKYFSGTVVIPWEEIASIGSSAPLTLRLKDGQALTGPVATVDGKLEVQTAEAGQVTTTKQAVQVIRSKEEEAAYQAELERLRNPKLLDLWKGFLDAGLATTHRNLSKEVDRGNFRADLIYRIRVARIQIPALRERLEDIPLLVSRFLGDFRAITGKPIQEISTRALDKLMEYAWPGNVRELRSAIEFAVIRCRGPVIRLEDLPPELKEAPLIQGKATPASDLLHLDEKERLGTALQRCGGNRTLAAKMLGISRATFYRRMSDLNLPIQ